MAHYKGAASEGNRAVNLLKKREKQKEELELLKKKIAEVSVPRNRYELHNLIAHAQSTDLFSRIMVLISLKCETSLPPLLM